jgi:uncharacterized protein (DUF58 family)
MPAQRSAGRPSLTREGWWFVVATVVVGAVAVDAGINLFFLAFGIMLSFAGAGLVLAALALARLRVRRVLPPAVFAGTPYLMGIALRNDKRRLPSFSIEVEDLVEGRPIEKRCYFLKLPAGRTQETAYRNVAPRRGRQQLTGFRLATKFPFGLYQRTRVVEDTDELIIFPALAPPPAELVQKLAARPGPGRAHGRGRQGDFAGLRAFRPGDDPRDIHWRTSARRGHPLVREHEEDEAEEATVVLDNAEESGHNEAAFERAVSEAAGICVDLVQRGFRVALATRGAFVAGDVGAAHTRRLLRALALVRPASDPLPTVPGAVTVRVRPGTPPTMDPVARPKQAHA